MNAFNAAMGQFELFDYIPLGVCILRRDFSVLFWNRYLEEWTGLKRGDILGHSILDQFPNLKSPVFHRRLQDVFDGGPPLVYSAQLHRYFIPCPLDSGQYRSQQTTVTPVPAPAEGDFYALVVIEDVTDMVQRLQDYRQMRDRAIEEIAERKWVEAELRQRNRELALLNRVITISAANPDVREILQTACREMVYSFGMTIATATMLNPDRTAVTNTAAYAVSLPDGALPFDPDSIIGMVIPVADIPLALEQLEQATSTPVVIHNPAESSVLGPARQYFEKFNVATMVILPLLVKGRLTGSLNLFSLAHRSLSERELATMQNVADQISGTIALAELNRLSRRLSAALEQSTECVLITDPQGRIEYANPAFEHTTGFTADEAAGQMLDILQSQVPETAEAQAQNPPADYTAALQTGQTWQGRLVSRKKDGTSFTEDVTLSPVR
ncbi:MAG: PAS domain S-box protein, partial [Chloroflexi bacterium]